MRLIDADALSEELSTLAMMITGLRAGKGVLNEFMKEYRKSVLRIVDEQPTIDPSTLRPKWISVEDRLPERGQEVIVYRNDCVYSMRFWDEKHPLWQSTSHWMPLPEPPNCGADMRKEAHNEC